MDEGYSSDDFDAEPVPQLRLSAKDGTNKNYKIINPQISTTQN